MARLEFDESMASQLEVLYNGRDVVRRRHLVREAVAVQPGEHVLDVGCGPGFYVKELLDQVGADGSVTGVDVSRAMLAVAAKRVDGHDNVAFHEAEATKLPVPDCAFDAAVSVQVLEYVPDVAVALAEIHRVLRPGGRIVIWDVDWATVSWHTADQMRRLGRPSRSSWPRAASSTSHVLRSASGRDGASCIARGQVHLP